MTLCSAASILFSWHCIAFKSREEEVWQRSGRDSCEARSFTAALCSKRVSVFTWFIRIHLHMHYLPMLASQLGGTSVLYVCLVNFSVACPAGIYSIRTLLSRVVDTQLSCSPTSPLSGHYGWDLKVTNHVTNNLVALILKYSILSRDRFWCVVFLGAIPGYLFLFLPCSLALSIHPYLL